MVRRRVSTLRLERLKHSAAPLLGGVVVIAGLLLSPGDASANFGSQGTCGYQGGSGCVSLANNKWHAVRFYSVTSSVKAGVRWGISQYDATDLVVYETSSDSLPDVRVFDGGYSPLNWVANVDCPVDNTGTGSYGPSLNWCRGQTLSVNLDITNNYNFTWLEWRSVGCHELGHTVGLRHLSTTTCMQPCSLPPPPDLSSCWRQQYLGSHEKNDHLNPFY